MFSRIAQSFLFVMMVSLAVLAQAQTVASRQDQTAKTSILIDRQLLRFTTPGEAVEWRLVVSNQQGEVIFDSGYLNGTSVEWPLQNQQGEAVESGLYAYSLSIKEPTSQTARTQRGHVMVDRAGSDSDRVWVTSDSAATVGADSSLSRLTVTGSGEATLGGAQMPEATGRTAAARQSGETTRSGQGRTLSPTHEDGSKAAAPASPQATASTLNRIAKFDNLGNLIDSAVTEVNGNLGIGTTNPSTRLHLFQTGGITDARMENNSATGFNQFSLIQDQGLASVFFLGGSNACCGYANTFVIRNNVGTPKINFEIGTTAAMTIDSSRNVGIGTTSPGFKLHVAGSMRWGGTGSAQPYLYSDEDGSGLFLEQKGTSTANSRMRLQSSVNGGQLNYSQFNIDPVNGFSFLTQGTGNGNVGIGTFTPQAKLDVSANTSTSMALRIASGGIQVAGAGVGTKTAVFIHVVTDDPTCKNNQGDQTCSIIDHPLTNNDPNAILIVTPHAIPPGGVGGCCGIRFPHPVAVEYSTVSNKWSISSEDDSNMPRWYEFNVLVVKP